MNRPPLRTVKERRRAAAKKLQAFAMGAWCGAASMAEVLHRRGSPKEDIFPLLEESMEIPEQEALEVGETWRGTFEDWMEGDDDMDDDEPADVGSVLEVLTPAGIGQHIAGMGVELEITDYARVAQIANAPESPIEAAARAFVEARRASETFLNRGLDDDEAMEALMAYGREESALRALERLL